MPITDAALPPEPPAWTLPGTPVQLRWCAVPRRSIVGVDPDIEALLREHFAQLADPIDLDAWTASALRWIYLRAPLVLKARRAGRDFCIIGSGVPLLVWQHAVPHGETVAAWVIERPARLERAHKYAIFAAEVMGLCALYGSHRRRLDGLHALWQRLQAAAPQVVGAAGVLHDGSGAAFARAMGISTGPTAQTGKPRQRPARSPA